MPEKVGDLETVSSVAGKESPYCGRQDQKNGIVDREIGIIKFVLFSQFFIKKKQHNKDYWKGNRELKPAPHK